jgi:hypothetical protein
MASTISPINKNQLFDPFYGRVPPDTLKQFTGFPAVCKTPKSVDVFEVFSLELRNNPFNFAKKNKRKTFYETNKYKSNMLVRRRAYEFAYCEFKREVRATQGNSAGLHISQSPRAGVPPYQEITGAYNAAWCASFTAWCYYQAGFKDIKNTSGLALALTWGQRGLIGKRQLREISPKQVEAGDLVVWGLETDDYQNDHVGFFSKWIIKPWENRGKIGLFTTIEGNTGPDRVVSVNASGKISFGAFGSGGRGVYGKKHTYDLKDTTDKVLGKTVTFGRIFAE